MLFGPRAVVRPRHVGGTRALVAQLCWRSVRLLVKKLGIVVDRCCQLFVSVVQLQTALPLRFEIQAPLDALWANLADGQRRIVSIVDVHSEPSRVLPKDICSEIFRDRGGAPSVDSHAADVPGSDLHSLFVNDRDLPAEI